MADTRGAALDYLGKRFGGVMRERVTTVTAGVAVQPVVGFDAERVFLVIVNLGANSVYVAPVAVPTATHGIVLSGNGGLVAFNVEDDAIMPCLEWNALGAAAALPVLVIEVRRDVAFPEVKP